MTGNEDVGEMMRRLGDAQAQDHIDMMRRLRKDRAVRLGYLMLPVVIMVCVLIAAVWFLDSLNGMVKAGLLMSALCAVLLGVWLWLDQSDDMLDCPEALRILIVTTGTLSLGLLVLGAVMPQ